MPREDETVRSALYGGHPPACTCVRCEERRLIRLRRKKNPIARLLQRLRLAK
ncbi:MAG: hypothetical protein V3S51_00840 [Dehalococcoidia bacterium]